MSCWDFSTNNQPAGEVCSYLQPVTQQTMCCHMFYSLRMFAVFSVVISTSGSLKYSDATHLPFSDPDRKHTHTQERHEGKCCGLLSGSQWCIKKQNKTNQKKKTTCVASAVLLTGNAHVLWQLWFQRPGARFPSFSPLAALSLGCFCALVAVMLWTVAHTRSNICMCMCVCVFYSHPLIFGVRIFKHVLSLPATKQTLHRPECSAIFTSMLWFCCRMMPSTMISQ